MSTLLDPFALGHVRPSVATETRAFPFTVQTANGPVTHELVLTLRGLDKADLMVVEGKAHAYARAYAPKDAMVIPQIIELGEGETKRPIAMSFGLCFDATKLLIAQTGPDRYTFEQLCAFFLLLGEAWEDVMNFAWDLDGRVKDSGKAFEADSPAP